jgi:hypothetical protein
VAFFFGKDSPVLLGIRARIVRVAVARAGKLARWLAPPRRIHVGRAVRGRGPIVLTRSEMGSGCAARAARGGDDGVLTLFTAEGWADRAVAWAWAALEAF